VVAVGSSLPLGGNTSNPYKISGLVFFSGKVRYNPGALNRGMAPRLGGK
jgi:hypothetical protein